MTLEGAFRAWKHSRKWGALYFFLVILSFWLIQFELLLQLYIDMITEPPTALSFIQKTVDLAAVFLMLWSIPALARTSSGGTRTAGDRSISLGFILLLSVSGILLKITGQSVFRIPGLLTLYGCLAWSLGILLKSRKNLGNRELTKYYRLLGLTFLIALPFLLAEHIREFIPALRPLFWVEAFALPSFFLALNVESQIFGRPFFHRLPAISKGKLSPSFCLEYKLTKRETEVAQLYARGWTFARVAEELSISPKTVDKHVENIYAKTGVRSQVQLIHLIKGGI